MVKKVSIGVVVVSLLFFLGCASKNKNTISPPNTKLEKKYMPYDVSFEYDKKDGKDIKFLREITRADTAKLTALKVGAFLLSIVGGLNGVPVNTDAYAQGFSKYDLMGSEIKSTKDENRTLSPIVDIQKKISDDLKKMVQKDKKLALLRYEFPIVVSPNKNSWRLVYVSLSGDTNNTYVLDSDIRVSRAMLLKSTFDSNKTMQYPTDEVCNYKSKPIALEKWEENDYQLVADTKKIIVDECINKISKTYDRFLSLPK